MAATGQEGTLARTHEGEPGLPRGRNRLPLRAVRASHRERLLGSVMAAVAEASYPAVTVADIVRRARVSRVAFYAQFADKEDCFLTATREGGRLMSSRVVSATRALPADAPDEEALRAPDDFRAPRAGSSGAGGGGNDHDGPVPGITAVAGVLTARST